MRVTYGFTYGLSPQKTPCLCGSLRVYGSNTLCVPPPPWLPSLCRSAHFAVLEFQYPADSTLYCLTLPRSAIQRVPFFTLIFHGLQIVPSPVYTSRNPCL